MGFETMFIMKHLFFLLCFLLVTACSSSPFVRSEYQLVRTQNYLVSNSYVHPTALNVEQEKLYFDYRVTVKNLLKEVRPVDLGSSFIMIGLRRIPITCRELQSKKEQFEIMPEQTTAINCRIELDKKEGMFQINDYKSLISISLGQDPASFNYLLRAEDFQ